MLVGLMNENKRRIITKICQTHIFGAKLQVLLTNSISIIAHWKIGNFLYTVRVTNPFYKYFQKMEINSENTFRIIV